ncbi:MAG TPA: hemolysin family protein [Opitutaceae bacterium]
MGRTIFAPHGHISAGGGGCMDVLIIMLLILLNGGFAMSEMAVVSARKARLQQRADEGEAGALAALALANEPGQFLSAVQVGITSIAILNGAFGEATVARALALRVAEIPVLAPYSQAIGLTIVVIAITYFSVVVGELVPKRLALHNPERVAGVVARPMRWFAKAAYPLVQLLNVSSDLVLRLIGGRPAKELPVTEEEIKVLMEQGTRAGVFEKVEQSLVANVLRMDAQRIAAIMTPRVNVYALDMETSADEIRRIVVESPYSRIVVCKGGLDNILGILQLKDLLKKIALPGQPFDVLSPLQTPVYVPDTLSPMRLLEMFKKTGRPMALVVNEYGDIEGLVTLNDVMEAIVGDIPSAEVPGELLAVRREDGSWLIDGLLPIERFKEIFELAELPDEDFGRYHTVGGFAMMQLARIPSIADHFEWQGMRLEVVDMDGNRVDKLLVVPPKPEAPR